VPAQINAYKESSRTPARDRHNDPAAPHVAAHRVQILRERANLGEGEARASSSPLLRGDRIPANKFGDGLGRNANSPSAPYPREPSLIKPRADCRNLQTKRVRTLFHGEQLRHIEHLRTQGCPIGIGKVSGDLAEIFGILRISLFRQLLYFNIERVFQLFAG